MMKKLLFLFFLLAFIKMEAQQIRGIEKSDIKRGNPQTGKEIKNAEENKPDTQRAADLKKLADELVNAYAIDDVTWNMAIRHNIEITKNELIDGIAGEAKLTKVDAGNALNALFSSLSESLSSRESLQLIHLDKNVSKSGKNNANSARVADLKKLADELVNMVANKAKLTKVDAGNALNAFVTNLSNTLRDNNPASNNRTLSNGKKTHKNELLVAVSKNKTLRFSLGDPDDDGDGVLDVKAVVTDSEDSDEDGYPNAARGMVIAKPSQVASNNPNNEEISSAATGDLKNIFPPGNKTKTSRFGSFDEIEYFAWEYLGENTPNAYYVVEITKIGNNGQAQQIFTGQVAANTHKNALTDEEINRATKKVAKFKAGKALADTVKRNGNPNQGENGEYQWTVKETTTGISSNPSFFTVSDADPCKIDIKPMGQSRKYCAGDTINLNWFGTTPTSQVTISLFDNTNNTVYAVLATGIANTGSYTYIIPSSFPCDPPRSWSLIVEDAEKLCLERSNPFIIECCNQQSDCDCGKWLTQNVSVKEYVKKIPRDPKLKKKFPIKFEKKVECGNKTQLKSTMNYTFTAPKYICNPENCAVEYKWEVVDANGIILSGTGKTFNHTFNNHGTYKIIFTPICGGKRCDPCIIYVVIDKLIQHDPDPIGIPYELPSGTIKDVYNPKTGKTWMNKNLGASQVATSPTDSLAYGDLYQWGRLTDGHEKRTSSTTATLSSGDVPGHGNFILAPNNSNDWRAPAANNLWQGLTGVNNPCPSGYRLPTEAEFEAERLSWVSNNATGAFASPLKWTVAGQRVNNGTIQFAGSQGYYWTSTENNTINITSSALLFGNNYAQIHQQYSNATGMSVRCIKD